MKWPVWSTNKKSVFQKNWGLIFHTLVSESAFFFFFFFSKVKLTSSFVPNCQYVLTFATILKSNSFPNTYVTSWKKTKISPLSAMSKPVNHFVNMLCYEIEPWPNCHCLLWYYRCVKRVAYWNGVHWNALHFSLNFTMLHLRQSTIFGFENSHNLCWSRG